MFSAYFTEILRVRRVRKILDVFEGFSLVFQKDQGKKDRGEGVNLRKSAVFCENLRFGLSLSP